MSDWMPYPWQLGQWQQILQVERDGKLPHALLVSGEPGIGKHVFLQGLAARLLCRADGDYPCGECKSCLLFAAGSHPDFQQVSPQDSRHIKVDQIRTVIDQLSQTAQLGGRRLVLITPAEAMNTASANALLKCLEEPGRDTVLILASHAPHRLLPTIRSRCQQLNMIKPDYQTADQWLSLSVSNADERRQLLALASDNPLLALAYHQADVATLFRHSLDSLQALASGAADIAVLAEQAQKHAGGKTTAEKAAQMLLWLQIHQRLLWRMIRQSMTGAGDDEVSAFVALTGREGFARRAWRQLELLQGAQAEVQGSSNPNLSLLAESVLINWQRLLRS